MKKYAIGADIGGSHISCAAVDIVNGVIISESHKHVEVNNKASANDILDKWAEALIYTANEVGIENIEGIGFGMPGPFEYDTGIARFELVEKYYNLNGVNVSKELSRRLEMNIPLRFMNDASAFAVGEAWLGSSSNVNHSVSVTLGTGFGSAFISDGVPVVEGDNIPALGCIWHIPYKEGIADDYFSTRWFIKRYKEETGIQADGVKTIAAEALKNDDAKLLFVEYGRNMGEFISPWLIKFDTNVLVIGGNISSAYNLFGPYFEIALKKNRVTTEIKLSKLKEDAAIIGSARLIDDNYWVRIKDVLKKM